MAGLSGAKAGAYMREWMNLTAVSSFMRFPEENCMCCTARDRFGVQKEYKVTTVLDSAGQYNVYERAINYTETFNDDGWQWVDAISA